MTGARHYINLSLYRGVCCDLHLAAGRINNEINPYLIFEFYFSEPSLAVSIRKHTEAYLIIKSVVQVLILTPRCVVYTWPAHRSVLTAVVRRYKMR